MILQFFSLLFLFFFISSPAKKVDLAQDNLCAKHIVVDTLPDPLAAGWKGGEVCKLLDENERFRTLKCTFPPGGGHDKHYHAPHFGYALSGSTFRIEDKNGVREVQLKSGSHFTSDGVDWHRVVNIGDSTSVYLIFEAK